MTRSAIINLTDSNFEQLLFHDPTPAVAVVDFWAEWCGPCQVVGSLLAQLAEEEPEVSFFKLNVDQYPQLANQYLIRALPTMLIFKNGELMQTLVGLEEKEQLRAIVQCYL